MVTYNQVLEGDGVAAVLHETRTEEPEENQHHGEAIPGAIEQQVAEPTH